MLLSIHIFICLVSLAAHSALLASNIHGQSRPMLGKSTLVSLVGAVISGLLLMNGSIHSVVHSLGMLGVLGMLHVAIYRARQRALAHTSVE